MHELTKNINQINSNYKVAIKRSLFFSPVCQIILYSEPNFLGECRVCDRNQEQIPERFCTKSFRVVGAT